MALRHKRLGHGNERPTWKASGVNGLAGSVGPGAGLSVSSTYTGTYSINDLIKDISDLFSNDDDQACP